MNRLKYVGIDVHKEFLQIAVLSGSADLPETEIKLDNDNAKIQKFFNKLLEKRYKLQVCYEAGCFGYGLHHQLVEMGIDCRVIAPGKIPREPCDRVKTDRQDALKLARLLRSGLLRSIYIPDKFDEDVRDYLRARDDLRRDLARVRQQLLKFLLRKGYKFTETRNWTIRHKKWLKELSFRSEMEADTFWSYMQRIRETEDRLTHMDSIIQTIAECEPYSQKVALLRCFRGIDYLTALSFVVEVGDFRRFSSAGSFMSFLGLTPSEHSSGGTVRRSGITKTGNAHLRRLLVEVAWHYCNANSTYVSKYMEERRTGQPECVIAFAEKTARRLSKKYRNLTRRCKDKRKISVAVAREMAGFIWGMMNQIHQN